MGIGIDIHVGVPATQLPHLPGGQEPNRAPTAGDVPMKAGRKGATGNRQRAPTVAGASLGATPKNAVIVRASRRASVLRAKGPSTLGGGEVELAGSNCEGMQRQDAGVVLAVAVDPLEPRVEPDDGPREVAVTSQETKEGLVGDKILKAKSRATDWWIPTGIAPDHCGRKGEYQGRGAMNLAIEAGGVGRREKLDATLPALADDTNALGTADRERPTPFSGQSARATEQLVDLGRGTLRDDREDAGHSRGDAQPDRARSTASGGNRNSSSWPRVITATQRWTRSRICSVS